jgi:hypothetical protein
MQRYLLIGMGAFLGANPRYIVQTSAAGRWGSSSPYGTLVANVSAVISRPFSSPGLPSERRSPGLAAFLCRRFRWRIYDLFRFHC